MDRQKQYVEERVNNIMLETIKLLEPYYQLSEDIAANRDILLLRDRQISHPFSSATAPIISFKPFL